MISLMHLQTLKLWTENCSDQFFQVRPRLPSFPYDENAAFVWRSGVVPGFRRGRWGLEVGDGREFVPLDRLLAEVKVFESERDAAQKVVLTQRLGAEHAQLKLP